MTKIIFRFCAAMTALTAALFTLVASGALTRAGVQNDFSKENSYFGEMAKAPAKASARRNPLENDVDAPRAGKKLYEQYCAECHGPNEREKKKAPDLHVDAVRQAQPGVLFWVITNGVVRRGMPVWSKLPEAQRWQIIIYLKKAPKTEAH